MAVKNKWNRHTRNHLLRGSKVSHELRDENEAKMSLEYEAGMLNPRPERLAAAQINKR